MDRKELKAKEEADAVAFKEMSLKKSEPDERLARKRITAAEARVISNTGLVPLTRIYKSIREVAAEGQASIYYCIQDWSEGAKEFVKNDLLENGYSLEELDHGTLKISW